MASSNKIGLEDLVPKEALANLEKYKSSIDSTSKALGNMLPAVLEINKALSESSPSYKQLVDIINKFNSVNKETVELQKKMNADIDNYNKTREKVINTVRKEIKAVSESTKSLNDNTKAVSENVSVMGLAREAYNNASNSLDAHRKQLTLAGVELCKMQAQAKTLDSQYKKNIITEREYVEQKTILNERIQNQKAVVKQLSDQVKYENQIVSTVIGSYNNLSAAYSLNKLNLNQMSDAEIKNGKTKQQLAKDSRLVYEEMNRMQQSTGKYALNVGNYASGWNGLQVQIQQVARELPSLTMGANTFFLAISNNLPMLADEIKKARIEYAAARAEGQKATPVWKQLLSGIFSWQTALVVGITLLSAYGKEIISWVGSLFKAKDAQMSALEMQEKVNETLKNSNYGQQIVLLKQLQEEWNGLGDSLSKKTDFIVDNKSAFDQLGVSITNVNDAENLLVDNTETFITALKLRAQANAAGELAAEKYKEYLLQITNLETERAKGVSSSDIIKSAWRQGNMASERATSVTEAPSANDYYKDRIKSLEAEANATLAVADGYYDLKIARQNEAQQLSKSGGFSSGVTESERRRQEEAERLAKIAADEAKKRVEAEKKAASELLIIRMQSDIDTQKAVSENNKKDMQERLTALDNYLVASGDKLTQAANNQLQNEKLTDSQRLLIMETLQSQLTKLELEGDKARESIIKDGIERLIKDSEMLGKNMSSILEEAQKNELKELSSSYAAGTISRETYEASKLSITEKYAKMRLEAEVQSIEDTLSITNLSEEQKAALTQKLRDAEVKYNEYINNELIKSDEKAGRKREDIEKKLADKRKDIMKDLYQSTFDLISAIFEATTEKNLNRLEKESEDNQSWRDQELERVQEDQDNKLISEEQAEAQRKEINQRAQANEDEIAQKRKNAEKRQLIFEKAVSLAKIAMETAKNRAQVQVATAAGIAAATAASPLTLGQPWAGMIAAQGATLLALVTATGAIQAASVAATLIPNFAEGTDFHKGGPAIVGDGGRSELVILPSGKMYKTPDSDTLVDLPRGTQVLPDYEKALMHGALMSPEMKMSDNAPIIIQENRKQLEKMDLQNKKMDVLIATQSALNKNMARTNKIGSIKSSFSL